MRCSRPIIAPFRAVMKPCGHVVCKTCTDKLVKPGKQCIHCDVKLAEKEIIQLTREGLSPCHFMIFVISFFA